MMSPFWKTSTLVPLVILLGLITWYCVPNKEPRQHVTTLTFIDRYRMIDDEMSERQVDDVFSGYPRVTTKQEREWTGIGKPLTRLSAHNWKYDDKAGGGVEGDLLVHVYFDAAGLVVGKCMQEYSK